MNAPGSPAAPATPPSSPWAQRYPLKQSVVVIGNKKRSLLRPHCPSIEDPKYYDQDPNQIPDHGIWNLTEVDAVFWSEKIQRRTFWGTQTWQIAALNRHLKFHSGPIFRPTPSGHKPPVDNTISIGTIIGGLPKLKISSSPGLPLYEKNDPVRVYWRRRIKVDEQKWLSFLRKDRWFDWIQSSPGKRKRPIKTWSVDEGNLWLALRPVLELANRFFQALINDSHPAGMPRLRTFVYGRIEDWRNFSDIFGRAPTEDATVIISYAMEEIIARQRRKRLQFDHAHVRTNQQVRDRLEKLLSSVIWGFGELRTCHAFTSEPSKGFSSMGHNYTIMITLNIHKIQSLLSPDLTLRELCVLQYDLASLLVHEITHAVLFSRNFGDAFVGNRSTMQNKNPEYEPYLDGKGLPEAGHIMEQLVFGGVHETLPQTPERACPPPMMHVLRTWPYASHTKLWPPANPNGSYLQDGALTRVYILPATYPSKLLSEEFWRDPLVPRKSDNFFHNSRIFRTTAPIRRLKTLQCGTPQVVVGRRRSQPYRYPEDETLIEEWNTQKDVLETLQGPWLHDDYTEWEASPWSDLWQRQSLRVFSQAFEERDHRVCAVLADAYVRYVDWTKGHMVFEKYMPTKKVASNQWIWHCIGLLMMASLPILKEELIEKETPTRYIVEAMPSMAAAAAGRGEQVYNMPDLLVSKDFVAPRSRLYDQTYYYAKGYGKGKVTDFSQKDYLRLIDDTIRMIMDRQGRVWVKFMDAINDARDKLWKQRDKLEKDYPRGAHRTRWVSRWPFELPEYDPTIKWYRANEFKWETPAP